MDTDNLTMKEMPASERPYEKCEKYGASVLSDAELLAVVIRTGGKGERATELALRILNNAPGKKIGGLFQMTLSQLSAIRGIGRVKAIQLSCLAEITKRMMSSAVSDQQLLCTDPEKVAVYFMPMMKFLEYEQVRLLILNGRNGLVKDLEISNGSFNSAMASPREIFYNAIKHGAVSVIVLHNHPSGDPSPSHEDILLTKRLADTGRMVGIPLLDHIIIGDNRYISMKESGYGI
ncbi:MAG TPA: hypothetical protein DCZ23_04525 [Lachnospiraceae bacterium]|nr:hypothetical protein [Lachnospiraceae bacterium]